MRAIAIAVVLASMVTPVFADHIAFYDTQTPLVCVGPAPAPFAPTTGYIVHQYSAGARASRWKLTTTVPGLTLLSISCGTGIPGDPSLGTVADYGGCMVGSFVACTVTYIRFSAEPITGCNHMAVGPYVGDPSVLVVDCAMVEKPATGGYFSFEMPVIFCDDCAVATQESTWGKVKALYR